MNASTLCRERCIENGTDSEEQSDYKDGDKDDIKGNFFFVFNLSFSEFSSMHDVLSAI